MTPPVINIAVVEDNDTLREALVGNLSRPGWNVLGTDCGEGLNQILLAQPVHVVVLDLNLPHEDGLHIARRLKQSHPMLRIIVLTARVRPSDRTSAYQTGVDVFLSKPTNEKELEAVIQNLAPRLVEGATEGYTLVRNLQSLATPAGSPVALTRSETLLLEQLALAPGGELHLDTLLHTLAGAGLKEFTRDSVVVLISRLRKKLEEAGLPHESIKAIRGFGYRLQIPLRLA